MNLYRTLSDRNIFQQGRRNNNNNNPYFVTSPSTITTITTSRPPTLECSTAHPPLLHLPLRQTSRPSQQQSVLVNVVAYARFYSLVLLAQLVTIIRYYQLPRRASLKLLLPSYCQLPRSSADARGILLKSNAVASSINNSVRGRKTSPGNASRRSKVSRLGA